mmetsp:Transcript_13054/g.12898  ORF Transcript_13054/g.12898 Transcript_13054/m.12898 type:complete len:296 (+) Transcript_13054:192-1079(+)
MMGNYTSSSSSTRRSERVDDFRSFSRHARSIEAETENFVTFVNETDSPVTLYWLDYKGRRKTYGIIAPGETHEQHTFLTHPWTFGIRKKKKRRKQKKKKNYNNSKNIDYQEEEEYEEKYGEVVVADGCRNVIFPSGGGGTTTTRVVMRKPSLCKWSIQNHGKLFPKTFVDSTKALLLCHQILGTRSARRRRSNNSSTTTKYEDNSDTEKRQQQLYDGKNSESSKIYSATSTINMGNSNRNTIAINLNADDCKKSEEGIEEVTATGLGNLPAELILKVIELSAPRIPFVLPPEPQQ